VFKQFAERVALIDGERQFTYANIDRLTDNLALKLSSFLKPLDRVGADRCRTSPSSCCSTLRCRRSARSRSLALVTHLHAEISQL